MPHHRNDRAGIDTGRQLRPGPHQAHRFGPFLDIGTGPGRGWAELVTAVNTQIRRGDGILNRPLVAAPLADAPLTGLLAVADHPFRPALAEP
ncbi:MAG TPA: hypothetical protein VGD71_18035, partial [Kribbella sp.]